MDVEMKVNGMGTGNDEKTIRDVVNAIDGVYHVEVLPDSDGVKISYDQERVSLEKICDEMEDEGYMVDR